MLQVQHGFNQCQRQQASDGAASSAGYRAGGSKFKDTGICALPFPQELLRFLPSFRPLSDPFCSMRAR